MSIIGVDSDMSPEVPYFRDSYWTLDKNFARWDIFRQPVDGAWTGHSSNYGQGFPLQLAPIESQLLKQIDAIASTVKPLTLIPGKSVNPNFPFKMTPITPKYVPGSGAGGPPNALFPVEHGGAPYVPAPQIQEEVKETNYLLIGGIAAVGVLLFFGTLKVK